LGFNKDQGRPNNLFPLVWRLILKLELVWPLHGLQSIDLLGCASRLIMMPLSFQATPSSHRGSTHRTLLIRIVETARAYWHLGFTGQFICSSLVDSLYTDRSHPHRAISIRWPRRACHHFTSQIRRPTQVAGHYNLQRPLHSRQRASWSRVDSASVLDRSG
jgi:hypothetical protein